MHKSIHLQKQPRINIISPRKSKIRLDVALVDQGLADSRTKAQALIISGRVFVDQKKVDKVGTLINSENILSLAKRQTYVSRGGEKLAGALKDLEIDVNGHVCMDVGSSTGGFTDCLLQHGAKLVFAIDVGRAQLIQSLKEHPKVISMEQTHIRDVSPELLNPIPTLAVIDVSFISLKKVLPKVKMLVSKDATIVAMMKPQFEVGPQFLKKGVVRSEAVQKDTLLNMIQFCKENGFIVINSAPSKLKGPKGNQEIFIHLVNKNG